MHFISPLEPHVMYNTAHLFVGSEIWILAFHKYNHTAKSFLESDNLKNRNMCIEEQQKKKLLYELATTNNRPLKT